ncbi:MAG: glycosyltransferase family 1 protein [Candidatus Binatia bacterium]|nr:glycosyltransferase family 1 protein [Candidatus Binatia bacterium]
MNDVRVAVGAVAGVTGGPATYVIELVRALRALEDAQLQVTVLTDSPDAFADIDVETVDLPLPSPWAQPWWDNVAVPRALRRGGFDVYHGTKHALPLLGAPTGVGQVVTIHDLAVYAEPDTFSWAQRMQLYVHIRHCSGVADRVICVSEHAANDVVTRLGIPREKITVIPHGIGSIFRPIDDPVRREEVRRKHGVEAGAFLFAYVGTSQPRKRIDVAIEAVGRLVEEGVPATLVIAGRRRPGYEPAWLESPPPFVRVLGEIPSEDLVDLLGAADVMVSPSSYEGFGLTFAEAMACGTPVVGVAVTSVPEVVGDGGVLVDAPDVAQVADALRRLVNDTEFRATKAFAARERAASLSWERAARASAEVYRAVQTD